MWPGHASVGDRSRPARLHTRVVRLHVRVRPEHRRRLPVEEPCERDLLARRLGVDVDDDHRRSRERIVDERLRDLERVDGRLEEQRPLQVDHGDLGAVGRGNEDQAPPRRA